MRDAKCDKAIEERFGEPDWNRSFILGDEIYTPIGNYLLFRIDPVPITLTKIGGEV